MLLKRVIVNVVLLLPSAISSVTKVTSLMLVPAVGVKFIISVETLSAEATFRMTLEPTLIDRSWIIVAELLVPP